MSLWHLPKSAKIGGKTYGIHTDFREILEIFRYFNDPALPEFVRWRIALALFYEGEIPPEDRPEAMGYLSDFLRCGQPDTPGPRLLDWEQDAGAILSGVNAVAGQEVRQLPYVHWWTFLGWFSAIGQGELAMLIGIRSKLSRGQKLEPWEQDFYRLNRRRVDLRPRYTPAEEEERSRLRAMLNGK